MNGLLLVDRFVLEREIGSGGMARVFLGKDTVLDRPVAVKVLNPGHDETDIGARFRREGRTAARLSHPNIVQVYDAGEAELDGKNVSYIVMEYVPGGDLKGLIDKRGNLSGGDLARLGAGAAAGLAHAHERGVIHRDVKPHNVLIDAYGEPKLTDFGIARALDVTTSQATRTGAYLGTALYSAPEQLQGLKVTPKSDVYSLGVTLYQAAAGEVPFVGTPMEVAGQHIHQPPVWPKDNGVEVGGRIEGLILDCLAKDPELRPTAEEVRDRLREEESRIRKQAMAPAPPAPEPRPTKQAPRPAPTMSAGSGRSQHRRRGPLLLGALALLLILLGLAAYSLFGGSADPNTASSPPQDEEQANAPAENGREDPQAAENADPPAESEQQPQGQEAQQGSAQQQEQAEQPQNPSAGGDQGGAGSDEPGRLTEEAAVQTIVDHYNVAASENYEDAWDFLSSRYQGEIGAQARWTNQFATLQRVEYTREPVATITGDTAEVSFSTRATHSDRTDFVDATAFLVQEDGRWKIDRLAA
jgi:serine/threonine protein kinase